MIISNNREENYILSQTKNSLSIFVPSCDKYSDVWKPFFDIFFQEWKKCPYDIYLGNNCCDFLYEGVHTISIGDDKGWGDGVIKMLQAVPTQYVLMIFDDLFIINNIDQDRIENLFSFMIEHNADCMRLNTAPIPSKRYDKANKIGQIRKCDPYCISAQVAIWKKETLLSLIKPNYTPWDFEFKGSKDEYKNNHLLLGVYNPAIITLNMIEKGKWQRSSIEYFETQGMHIDLSSREVINNLVFPRGIEKKTTIYSGAESFISKLKRNALWWIRFNIIARIKNAIYQ